LSDGGESRRFSFRAVKRASRGVWRISKKSLLSGGGIFSEKGIEELKRGFTLTLSGDHQAWDNTL
jgi:hypothetical protein